MSSGRVASRRHVAVAVAAQVVGQDPEAVRRGIGTMLQVPDGEVAGDPVDHHDVGTLADPLVVELRIPLLEVGFGHRRSLSSFDVAEGAQAVHHARLLLGVQGELRPGRRRTGAGAPRRGRYRGGPPLELARLEDLAGHAPGHVVGHGQRRGGSRMQRRDVDDRQLVARGARRARRARGEEHPRPAVVPARLVAARDERVGAAGSTSSPPSASTIETSGPSASYGPENASSRVHDLGDERPPVVRARELAQARGDLAA